MIFLSRGSIHARLAASPKGPVHWPKRIGFLLGDARIACQATDAAMLARMGSLLDLKVDKPKSETLHNLKGMETARQALIKDRTAARARLATAAHPLLKKQATHCRQGIR